MVIHLLQKNWSKYQGAMTRRAKRATWVIGMGMKRQLAPVLRIGVGSLGSRSSGIRLTPIEPKLWAFWMRKDCGKGRLWRISITSCRFLILGTWTARYRSGPTCGSRWWIRIPIGAPEKKPASIRSTATATQAWAIGDNFPLPQKGPTGFFIVINLINAKTIKQKFLGPPLRGSKPLHYIISLIFLSIWKFKSGLGSAKRRNFGLDKHYRKQNKDFH